MQPKHRSIAYHKDDQYFEQVSSTKQKQFIYKNLQLFQKQAKNISSKIYASLCSIQNNYKHHGNTVEISKSEKTKKEITFRILEII